MSEAAADSWERTVVRDMAIGRRVGDYVIRRRIGSGGMGIVYEAEHPQIHRRVAIKVLRPDRAVSRDLLSEARALSAVRHRHIIDVFGFGELPGLGQYLVMDYLEGRSLEDELRARGPLPASEVIAILDDAAAGLCAAHAVGVVHRDLKPGNLFLVRESSGSRYLKVLDFGLAKATAAVEGPDARRQTAEGTTLGTPDYIAPEQARGKAVDGRTDLYSLGVIAFEMMTGRVPFAGATAFDVAVAHVRQAPPSPRSLEPTIPVELETLVLELLEKDPSRRPASAQALRDELARVRRLIGQAHTQPAIAFAGPLPAEPLDSHSAELAARPAAVAPGAAAQLAAPPPRWSLLVSVGASCALLAVVATIALGPRPQQPPPLPAPQPVVPQQPVPLPPEPEALQPASPPEPDAPPQPPKVAVGVSAPAPAQPRAAPRPPVPAKPGALLIITRGCSMEVTIDGQVKGHTPTLPAQAVAPGRHQVELRNQHCIPALVERNVQVKPGAVEKIELSFEKK